MGLVVELGRPSASADLREALARALGDRSLELAYCAVLTVVGVISIASWPPCADESAHGSHPVLSCLSTSHTFTG
jgi:hypothetical protein